MCGILGGNIKRWNYKEAIKEISHRGPDGEKIVYGDSFVLAFTRLAILDLSETAMQPMISEDSQVQVVFNGEIYNYKNLRKKLEKDYFFKTTSDTEVILAAYLKYGDRFIHHIDGMFAMAVYDMREQKVKLYRDRVGIKPLYYFYNGIDFAFCSEIKGLTILLQSENLKIDNTAIFDFLTYNYIPEPKSMYKNIYKLEPAHLVVYDVYKSKLSKPCPYWKLKANVYESENISIDEARREIKKRIGRSVKRQLNADVPVGTFLSGGMDSSVIVDEVHKLDKSVCAFCVGFEDNRYSELEYAHIVAKHLKINLKSQICSKETICDLYESAKGWFGEPFSDTSCYPTYLVSKLAARDVKVVLTGDGGDEIFGGYSYYQWIDKKLIGLNSKDISYIYKKYSKHRYEKLDDFFLDDFINYARYTGFVSGDLKEMYAKVMGIPKDYDMFWHLRKFYHKELPVKTRFQYMDFHTFLGRVLTKVDRVAMRNSIETRVPLLDTSIIEYVFSLPENIRYYRNELKGVLKYAYKEELPAKILNRKKQGFTLPPQYMKQDNSTQQEEMLKNVWGIFRTGV